MSELISHRRRAKWRNRGYVAFFVGPAMLILGCFAVLPILVALLTSFTDLDLRGLIDWSNVRPIGLDNYVDLVGDPRFLAAAGNTAIYVILGVPLIVFFALAAALMVNYGTSRLFKAYRAMFFLPAITNTVAVAAIWGYLYNTDSGLINAVLGWAGAQPVPWLDQPLIAKCAVIAVGVWQGASFNTLIFLAALQGIPSELYEAAEVDGAGPWRRLRSITLPMLSFATFFVTITTTIHWIQMFEVPLIMTGGGPLDGTLSMALFIYQDGFGRNQYGYASAASFLLFAVIVIVTAVQFRLRRRDADV